jgi:tetratricopeptide (TPR) repeat protein
LHRGLAHLQAAEFLYETRLFPEQVCTFKHALTHEVAYGSLLHERRRALHARIVEAMEVLSVDRLSEQVERLAHYALRGKVWDKAMAYCRQAGEKAMAQSAYREAVGDSEQALSALLHLPETRDTREQAIDLRLALRTALLPSGDEGRILAYLREAESLATALDDPTRLGQVSRFLSTHFFLIGAYDQAITSAQCALTLATAGGDVVLHALANLRLGHAYQAQGDYRQAIDCFRQTVTTLDGVRRYERFGQVILPAVLSHAYLAWGYAELGTFAEGRAFGEEGLRIAEAVDHSASLMIVSWGGWSAVPPSRRPAQGTSPARTGCSPLSGRRPPRLLSLGGCGLGGGVYLGWARHRRHAAARAGEGTGNCRGNGSHSGAL